MVKVRFGNLLLVKKNINVYWGKNILAHGLSHGDVTSYIKLPSTPHGYDIVVKEEGDERVLTSIFLKRFEYKHNNIFVGAVDKKIKIHISDSTYKKPKPGYSVLRFFNFGLNAPETLLELNNSPVFTNVHYGNISEKKDNVYFNLSSGTIYHKMKLKWAHNENVVLEKNDVHLKSGNVYTFILIGNLRDKLLPLKIITLIDNPGLHDVLQKGFDAQEYMGTWYQIANIPQPFEAGLNCVRSKAVYTLLSENIKVHNICLGKEGQVISNVYGQAIVPDKNQAAALIVSFPNFVPPAQQEGFFDPKKFKIPSGPNYLIHSTDYNSYAVVGSSDRSGFYILSRHKKIKKQFLHEHMKYAKELGYDVKKIHTDEGSVIS